MDKFYCKQKTKEQFLSGKQLIIIWFASILITLFLENNIISTLIYLGWITFFWLSLKIGDYYHKSKTPFILFGEKALICQQEEATKWYIDYTRLNDVNKTITKAKFLQPKLEEILFSTIDGDSYAIPNYTLTDQQIDAIRQRIREVKAKVNSPLAVS